MKDDDFLARKNITDRCQTAVDTAIKNLDSIDYVHIMIKKISKKNHRESKHELLDTSFKEWKFNCEESRKLYRPTQNKTTTKA